MVEELSMARGLPPIAAMAAVLLAVVVATPARAVVDVDLELILAVDVSGSMDRGEADLNKQLKLANLIGITKV